MLLADMIVIWVGGLLLIGFFGFFALVLAAVARVFRAVFRAVFGGPCNGDASEHEPSRTTLRACPRPQCGYLNPGPARFCARCGHPLDGVNDVDRYG